MNDGANPLTQNAAEPFEGQSMWLPEHPGSICSSILAVADMLPVMVAFLGEDLRYRFMNKPMADWFERPRSAASRVPHERNCLGEKGLGRPQAR